MKLKKMTIPAMAISIMLLAVGCKDNKEAEKVERDTNVSIEESAVNPEVEVEELAEVTMNYAENVVVKSFFDLTGKDQSIKNEEFINYIETIKLNKGIIVDNKDIGYGAREYIIKENDSSVSIKAIVSEDIGEVTYLELRFEDEKVKISYNVPLEGVESDAEPKNYYVAIESKDDKLISKGLEKYKTGSKLEKQYIQLKEYIRDNKDATLDDIETVMGVKLDKDDAEEVNMKFESIEVLDGKVVSLSGDVDEMTITLDGDQIAFVRYRNSDVFYEYENYKINARTDEMLKGPKYIVSSFLKDKKEVIDFLEGIFKG